MAKTEKERLDMILVERGLAASREQAQRFIRAGQVWLGTRVLDKPGARWPVDIELDLRDLNERFVSRGGWKLQGAIDAWPTVVPPAAVCADIGASTGGFTDCLLQHGAARVYAIDVGRGQLALSLREDPRVVVMEQTNARNLTAESLPEPLDLVVSDVSFISLRLILPPAANLLKLETGQAIVLIKPQFEAGPENVGKGGVVRDPATHHAVLRDIAIALPESIGMIPRALKPSPIKGPKGNREYLLHLTFPKALAEGEKTVNEQTITTAVEAAFLL